jgi:gentisate 1,2-dioxygenase
MNQVARIGSVALLHRKRRFDWQQGYSFVVPLWYAHRHLNDSLSDDAILISMSDALKALALYCEEAC